MRVPATKTRNKRGSRDALSPAAAQQAAPAPERIWNPHGWRIALLWALLFAAYSNSFDAGLVFDNDLAILRDPRVHAATLPNVRRILTEGYWVTHPEAGLYRPLTTLSYLVNYAVLDDGTNPAGYHWVNLALHGVNVTLVYALGLLIFLDPALALALAALWGLHPLLTESVTNIVGRADLLAAFGVLAGLLCYIQGTASTGRRKLGWFVALLASQAAGLFSKENAAVLPGILLLYDLTWPHRARWRQRIWFYAGLLLPFGIHLFLRNQLHTHMEVAFLSNPLISAGFWTARLTAIKVIGKFLWLFIWPARLSADYSYNAVPLFGWHVTDWEDVKTLFSLAVCLGAVWLAARSLRSRKPLFFFLGFFFVALLPTANLVILIGSFMAERFFYLPSLGLAGCAVAGIYILLQRLSPRWPSARRTAWIALSALCLAFGARTYARNLDWYDALSLWTSAVNATPDSARPHLNLGNALLSMPGRSSEAIAEYQAALRIEPNYAEAHNNLGDALAQSPARLPEAIAEYEAALRIDPNYTHAHNNLGSILSRMPGRTQDAIAEFKAALRADPNYAQAHSNLGSILSQIPGRMPEAVAELQTALRMEPDLASGHYNLGNALAQTLGRLPDAAAEFQTALRLEPGDAGTHNNLGNVFALMPGRMPDAIAEWKAALRIDPALAQTHYNLGIALAQMPGRIPDAIAELEAALRIRPNPGAEQLLNRLRATRRQ